MSFEVKKNKRSLDPRIASYEQNYEGVLYCDVLCDWGGCCEEETEKLILLCSSQALCPLVSLSLIVESGS